MDRMRVLLVGVGGFGHVWRTHLPDRSWVEIVGLVDPDQQALDEGGEVLGVSPARRYTELSDALNEVDADLAIQNTPPKHRLAHARQILPRGIDMLTAKPLTETLADARKMIDLAQKHNRILAVNQQLRYGPVPRKLGRMLREGAVGKIDHFDFSFFQRRSWDDRLKDVPSPLFVESSVHHFDFLRSIAGCEVDRIFSDAWTSSWTGAKGETSATAILKMADGSRINYRASRSAKVDLDPEINVGWYGRWFVEGTEGILRGSEKEGYFLNGDLVMTPEEATTDAGVLTLIGVLFDDVCQAIQDGRTPETSGADNLWTMATCQAAYESYHREAWVDMKEFVQPS